MLTCKEVCENASDAIEEKPGFSRRLGLGLHLLICKHCRRFLRQLRVATSAVASLPEPGQPTEAEIDLLIARLRQS
ncbi:MAG: anti-sigma factor [Pseudomonadota bacterium]